MAGPKALNEELVRSLPDHNPVVMVNLVRFRDRSLDGNGSGWDAYSRYSKGDMPLLKKVGGTVIWAGRVEGVSVGDLGDGRWDWVVLALYPSRAAFLEMMTSPEYAAINVDRENGVEITSSSPRTRPTRNSPQYWLQPKPPHDGQTFLGCALGRSRSLASGRSAR